MKLVDPKQPKKIQEEQKRDVALYLVEDGEAGFSPEWNKAVIERTIKKTNELRKKKHKQYLEGIGERADAVATYLKSRFAAGVSPIDKYFGKRNLARLRGEKILKTLKGFYNIGGKKRKLYLPGD